jgi:hypothetical protein
MYVVIADLCQSIIQDLIEGLYYSIFLMMVWCTLMVINFKLLSHRPNCTFDKVSSLVTHQNPRTSKYGDHLLKQEVCCCLYTAVFD